ncbi:MAG: His/Gly/Thr/Pro-type tRNA ligase C-terminal domain-containing protein, partial [Dermatophilaceae bacterium]
AAYQKHRDAYIRIFDRLGFDYVIVKAMAGAMGGSKSEEFLATAENGEDTYVRTADGSYAANVEAVIVPQAPPVDYTDTPAAHAEDTPDTPTIETLVAVANANHPRTDGRAWTAADTLKNVIVMLVSPDGTREPLAIGLPGDRDVDLKRLEAQVAPAEIEAFDEKDFATHPGLVKGYIGPGALGEAGTTGIRYLLDPRVGVGSAWVTGANEPGRHVFHLVHGRDFEADGTVQAAEVRDGDEAPDGSGPLESARGIEMGHIFQLGTKYAEALDLKVLDQNGKLVTVTMGSYGVGVSRAVGCVAEGNHDEFGLIWPRELSPVDVHIVATGKDTAVHAKAEEIASALEAQGISSIVDDRWQASPGVKFKDAELIGVPTIVVVGKGLANGVIEIKDRRTAERREIDADGIVAAIVTEVRGT